MRDVVTNNAASTWNQPWMTSQSLRMSPWCMMAAVTIYKISVRLNSNLVKSRSIRTSIAFVKSFSIKRYRLNNTGIPMLKISRDRLIFKIPIPGKDGLYIETGHCTFPYWANLGSDLCSQMTLLAHNDDTASKQRLHVNTLRPRQSECHLADDIFKCIFLSENVWIPIKISLKYVPKGPTNNIPALVQRMAWRRPGGKPLSEPMMASLPTQICVTRPQWLNFHIALRFDIAAETHVTM